MAKNIYNYSSVDWSKTDLEIATELGCAPLSVFNARKKREIYGDDVFERPKREKQMVPEPVNMEVLFQVMSMAGHRPGTPEAFSLFVEGLINDAKANTLCPGFIGCGGIEIRSNTQIWIRAIELDLYLSIIKNKTAPPQIED